MYALIYNNKIEVGPRDWSYWIFRNYLTENNLDFSELPYIFSEPIITENWKILPITQLDLPERDPLFEDYAGPYWTVYDTYITGYCDKVNIPVHIIQGNMKNIVAANRYEVEIAGIEYTFTDNTTVEIYTSREDRSVYLDALIVMGDTDTIDFKFKNGIFKTVTKSDLQAIVTLGSQHIKNVFAWEAAKIQEITDTQTFDALKLIELKHPNQITS